MASIREKGFRTGLIGRERELEELDANRRAASAGHGRIVLVGGDAGIGKSRLVRSFTEPFSNGRAFARSHCVEFVQTPLSPLREMLSQLHRRENAPPDAATRSLIERLDFERTIDSASGPLPGGALFDALGAAFAHYALRGTVVLLIEDVHWADRSTLAFLTYFAGCIENRRILVIATYRSDEVGAAHPRLAHFATLLSKSTVSSLSLAALDDHSTSLLVERLVPVGTLSATTVGGIARRSGGNPFFAEELVKSAVEARDIPDRALPLSIRAAVLARAAQLSDADRSIVSLAAVLGERFSIDQLVTLMGGEREAVLGALERARQLSLLYDEPVAPGEIAFRHALTQEVLYGELLAERVRPLHESIALELEAKRDRDAFSVELAHHWRRAGDFGRAALYDELAGDHAAGIGAFADAVHYYERARAARTEASAELEHKTGVALGALNHLKSGIERLYRAAELYRQAGDFGGLAKNASALGAQLYNSGDPQAATNVYRDALGALRSTLPSDTLNLLRARIAYNCVAALDFEAASAFAGELPDSIADPFVAMYVYQTRFRIAAMRGDLKLWRENSEKAVAAAGRIPDAGTALRRTQTQIGLDAVALGEIDYARERLSSATHEQRQDWLAPLVSAASALEHTLRGDFDGAARLLEKARIAPEQAYAIQIHVKSANFALGIFSGDDSRLSRDDSESFLRYGINHGMKLGIGLLGGPYAWALGLRGELDEAATWISQIAAVLPGPHRFMFAYLAAAQFGKERDVLAMREQLIEAAAHPQDRVNKAASALFDAFAAARGIVQTDARAAALAAGAGFEKIGWPWPAARGYELGGESRRALEMFRALGSLRDSRRVEADWSVASGSVLSSRESEVATLVSSGHSNEEIAQILHISSRTAEKHVSSALQKLHLRSRVQLGRLFARSQNGDR